MSNSCKMAEEQADSTEILKRKPELKEKYRKKSNDNVRLIQVLASRDDSVNVVVRMSIIRVGEIDAVRQEFHCEFFMRLRWEEPRLQNKTIDEQKEMDEEDIDWNPSYYFANAVNIQDHERWMEIIEGEPPQVTFGCRIIGTFKDVLKVNNFPFDYQDLSLTLTSQYRAGKLTFVKDWEKDDNIRTEYFYPTQEWELKPHVITEQKTLGVKEGSSSNIYPQYIIRMNVMRKYKFYIYNVFLILFLITALTFSSFAVEASARGARILIPITLLLTSVAFKYNVQQYVPRVPYLTLVDKYIFWSMIFQFFMAVRNAVSGFIIHPSKLLYFEWISFGIAVLVFTLINARFGYLSFKCIKYAKLRMQQDKAKYKENNRFCYTLLHETHPSTFPNCNVCGWLSDLC